MAAGAARLGPVQLNNSMSLSNLCSVKVSRRAELNYNQIGCHAVIQMSSESNARILNMLTWAESLPSF